MTLMLSEARANTTYGHLAPGFESQPSYTAYPQLSRRDEFMPF